MTLQCERVRQEQASLGKALGPKPEVFPASSLVLSPLPHSEHLVPSVSSAQLPLLLFWVSLRPSNARRERKRKQECALVIQILNPQRKG